MDSGQIENRHRMVCVLLSSGLGETAAAGADSAEVENIYQRTVSADAPDTPPTAQLTDFVPRGWTDDPIGVDSVYQFEWSVFRSKTDTGWSPFSNPVLWAMFREN